VGLSSIDPTLPCLVTATSTKEVMNPKLEMLMQREQLMEDIDCIVDECFQGIDQEELDEVTRLLCDAVCRNFPSN